MILGMSYMASSNAMRKTGKLLRLLLPGLIFAGTITPCQALEPEPRKWNHLPTGTNYAGVGYARTEADIAFDPTLLLEDAKMDMDTWVGQYIRTFELFDKSARIDLTQAHLNAEWKGLLNGAPVSTARNGWADSFVRLAMNLYGAPPLSGKQYAAYRAKMDVETIVGVGLAVRLPTGQYMDDKLINLGENRFVFRPQLGVLHTRNHWTVEGTAEVAFHTDNDDFFNGKKLEQKPLYILYGNLSYMFRPGQWLSAGVGYDYGGEHTVDNIDKNDRMQDIGWALTYAHPLNRQSGIKIKYVGTRTQESTGTDSDTVLATVSYAW
jgi:hypothetical protein